MVLAEVVALEALLSHGGESPGVDIFCLDGGDIASVARDHCIFGLDRILHEWGVTLLWKCAYDDLYMLP